MLINPSIEDLVINFDPVLTLDLLATLIFAMVGCFKAIKYELDLLGMMMLAIITGIGGGIMRDMLFNELPYAVLQGGTYVGICFIGMLIVLALRDWLADKWNFMLILDACGLATFTYVGANLAYTKELSFQWVCISAGLTSCGGGIIRDVLVGEIPSVMRKGFYLSASLLGGVMFYLSKDLAKWTNGDVYYVTCSTVILLRLLALWFDLGLPNVKSFSEPPSVRRRKI